MRYPIKMIFKRIYYIITTKIVSKLFLDRFSILITIAILQLIFFCTFPWLKMEKWYVTFILEFFYKKLL